MKQKKTAQSNKFEEVDLFPRGKERYFAVSDGSDWTVHDRLEELDLFPTRSGNREYCSPGCDHQTAERIAEALNEEDEVDQTLVDLCSEEILQHNMAEAEKAESLLVEDGVYQLRRRFESGQWLAWRNRTEPLVAWLGDCLCEVRSIQEGEVEYLDGKWIDFAGFDVDEAVKALAEVVPMPGKMRYCVLICGDLFPKHGIHYFDEADCKPYWVHGELESSQVPSRARITPNDVLEYAGKEPLEMRSAEDCSGTRRLDWAEEYLQGKWIDFTGYSTSEAIKALAGLVPDPVRMREVAWRAYADMGSSLGIGLAGGIWVYGHPASWTKYGAWTECATPNDVLEYAGKELLEVRPPEDGVQQSFRKFADMTSGYCNRESVSDGQPPEPGADTRRLDWLEEHRETVHTVWGDKNAPLTTDPPRTEIHRAFLGWVVGDDIFVHRSPRIAIDAAIARKEKLTTKPDPSGRDDNE